MLPISIVLIPVAYKFFEAAKTEGNREQLDLLLCYLLCN
jgi:hypothetical protein